MLIRALWCTDLLVVGINSSPRLHLSRKRILTLEAATTKHLFNPRLRDWLIALAVGFFTCLIFLSSLQNGFVNWDDRVNLIENPYYRGLGWTQLRWMFTTLYHGLYQPLYWVTLGADYVLWGLNPFGYHLTSLLLHAINAALFYFLALRLLSLAYSPSESSVETALRIGAAFAALFFAIHPLRVESVAWVTERRDVLSGFFLLSATLLYLRAVTASEEAGSRRWLWLSLTLFVYLLSLLSKAIGMTFPLILLVLDVYPLRRLGWSKARWFGTEVRRIWLEKISFLFLACLAGAIAVHAQRQVGASLSFEEYGFVSRIVQSLFGLSFYIVKTFVPIRLSPLYQLPGNMKFWSLAAVLLVLSISAVTIGLYLLRRRWPAGFACWVCYIVLLFPVLGVVQIGVQLVADRYSYLSCLGWAVLAGAGFVHCWLASANGRLRRIGLVSVATLAVFILGGLGVLTTRQIGIWHDSERLWRHALIVSESGIAHNNLATVLYEQGKVQEAIEHYQKSLEFTPQYVDANYNLATVFYKEGRFDEAAPYFRKVLEVDPNHAKANYNLANVLVKQNQFAEAVKFYQAAIRVEPGYAEAHSNLGNLYMLQGDFDKAQQESMTALRINPGLVKTRFNLGLLFIRQKNLTAARKEFEQIIKTQPDFAESRYYLGTIMIAQNDVDKGVEELRTAP